MTSVQQRKKVIVRSPIDGEAYPVSAGTPLKRVAIERSGTRTPEILVSTVTPHQQLHQVVV